MRTKDGQELMALDLDTLRQHIKEQSQFLFWSAIWEVTLNLFGPEAAQIDLRFVKAHKRWSVQVKDSTGYELIALDEPVRELREKEEYQYYWPQAENVYEFLQTCLELEYTELIMRHNKWGDLTIPNEFLVDQPPRVEFAVYGIRQPNCQSEESHES